MMHYTDTFINDYSDAAFQTAFRAYFAELGCHVTNWPGFFAGMGETHREYTWTKRDQQDRIVSFTAWLIDHEQAMTLVRREASGRVVGFIQLTTMALGSWFFRETCGFIQEFWIAPELRRQGYGSELLEKAERCLQEQGCRRILLTTDTVPDFYGRHGYCFHSGIEARNKAAVFEKVLK